METKKVWARLGVTFLLTAEEFATLEIGGNAAEELICQKVQSDQFELDGETYFPENNSGHEYEWQHRNEFRTEF